MIESEIEANVITALQAKIDAAALVDPTVAATVVGWWTSPADGATAEIDGDCVAVMCGPKQNESESQPRYMVSVDLRASTMVGRDPRRVLIHAWAECISSLFDDWNGDPNSEERLALETALSGTGYSVTGLADAGGTNGCDINAGMWFFGKTLTVYFVQQ